MATPSSSSAIARTSKANTDEANQNRIDPHQRQLVVEEPNTQANRSSQKRKRKLAGTPHPDAKVIALSPNSLTSDKRRYGFSSELGKRGLTASSPKKRVYTCPEPSCIYHHPSRALGDLTGIKKHYLRKHGEKKFNCDNCFNVYALETDLKAHAKLCITRNFNCKCGSHFSKKDTYLAHISFCNASNESLMPTYSLNTSGSFEKLDILNGNNEYINNNISSTNFLLPVQNEENKTQGYGVTSLSQNIGFNEILNISEGTKDIDEMSFFSSKSFNMQSSPTFTSPMHQRYNNYAQIPISHCNTFSEPAQSDIVQHLVYPSSVNQSFSPTSSRSGYDVYGDVNEITRDFLGEKDMK